ncbi:hypothetical protein [Sorangium sp. So ce1151]|uniref:hypothetical protein n=1 Tax=Sorangium sp. So ce1151 TaxID=3133332 RepID=UPI003F5FDB57
MDVPISLEERQGARACDRDAEGGVWPLAVAAGDAGRRVNFADGELAGLRGGEIAHEAAGLEAPAGEVEVARIDLDRACDEVALREAHGGPQVGIAGARAELAPAAAPVALPPPREDQRDQPRAAR